MSAAVRSGKVKNSARPVTVTELDKNDRNCLRAQGASTTKCWRCGRRVNYSHDSHVGTAPCKAYKEMKEWDERGHAPTTISMRKLLLAYGVTSHEGMAVNFTGRAMKRLYVPDEIAVLCNLFKGAVLKHALSHITTDEEFGSAFESVRTLDESRVLHFIMADYERSHRRRKKTVLEHLRILVVDDEPLCAREVVIILADNGITIPPVQVTTLGKALRLLNATFPDDGKRFDLVITDYNITGYPDYDGGDQVAEKCRTYRIPVVMVTNDTFAACNRMPLNEDIIDKTRLKTALVPALEQVLARRKAL